MEDRMSQRSWIERRSDSNRWRRAYLVTFLLTTASCDAGTTVPSSTSTATLHSEVSDSSGDALSDPSVPISPDLVHGTVDVSARNITLTIQFAPRTFDPSTSRLTIDLDTDQNPSTGIRAVNGLGVEYALDMSASTAQVNILKAIPTGACTATDACYVQVGVAPLSIAADGMAVTLPVTMLGSIDGRVNFRVFTYASRAGEVGPTITSGVMHTVARAELNHVRRVSHCRDLVQLPAAA
jgi:hypothetical protein